MGKHKHSKAMGFLHISYGTLIHTIPKICGKWILIVRENIGKHEHFKVIGSSNILDEAEINIITKTWEIGFP